MMTDTPPAEAEPASPTVGLVRMIRAEPQHEGGPVTADVHPDSVAEYEAGGWIVSPDHAGE